MASLNITSLPKHFDELKVFLAANTIDILAINETRPNSSIHGNEVHIPGYEIVLRDRVFNRNLKIYDGDVDENVTSK